MSLLFLGLVFPREHFPNGEWRKCKKAQSNNARVLQFSACLSAHIPLQSKLHGQVHDETEVAELLLTPLSQDCDRHWVGSISGG